MNKIYRLTSSAFDVHILIILVSSDNGGYISNSGSLELMYTFYKYFCFFRYYPIFFYLMQFIL